MVLTAAATQVATNTEPCGMPALPEDRRVDERDVDHGQEGGQPGDEFGTDVGALLLEPEIALDHAGEARLGLDRRLAGLSAFCPFRHRCPLLPDCPAASLTRRSPAGRCGLWMM
ncbi:MAG: hypothetical protein P8Y53_12145 [Pseudolabrys sp.]